MHTRYGAILGAALLLIATGQATAAAHPAQAATGPAAPTTATHLLPVFVQVNDQGKITHVEPADSLQPAMRTLLRQTLNQMITRPAHDAKGRAIASQFIVTLSLRTASAANDRYAARFVYVSARPVPAGQWHWIRVGKQMALARKNSITPDPMHQQTTCSSDAVGGDGHRKVYISSRGVYLGSEPDVMAGKCPPP